MKQAGKSISLVALFATAVYCPLFINAAALAETFIVKDGKPAAEIIISAKPKRTVKLAAEELQTYLEKISGAKLPIASVPGEACPVKIYVGRSAGTDRLKLDAAGLQYDAFRIVSGKNYLALIGTDDDCGPVDTYLKTDRNDPARYEKWDELTGGKFGNPMEGPGYCSGLGIYAADARGSLNAVYEFLRGLGVRWYFPGEIGEVVPAQKDIPLPEVNRTVRPDFAFRNFFIYYQDFRRGSPDYVKWQLRMGVYYGQDLIGLGSGFGHGLGNVHCRDKHDPEWFALFDGQRSTKGNGEPCLSSEGLFEATLKYARAMFRIYPGQRMIDLGPVDGYGNLCQCNGCKDQGTFERGWNGRMSDYVWGFVDRVAQELYKTNPDRMVNCIAYSGYQLPPLKIKAMSPNVTVTICRWRSDFIEPETKAAFRKITEDWLEKLPSKELYIWDYYLHGRPDGAWEGVPVYYPHIVADDLRFLKGKSKGDFIEIAENWHDWKKPWQAMAANHLNVYVTSRFYWDAAQDVDGLLEEYFQKFYGPAARPMRAFVEYAEANWKTAPKNAQVIDRLAAMLAEARGAAGDSVYGRRVDIMVEFMKPLMARRDKIAEGRKGVPEAVAPKRDKAGLKLDGNLDDAFWQGLEAHPLRDLVTGGTPAQPGSVRFAWADGSLYLAVVCQDADMPHINIGASDDENTNIFNGDNVELLLETQTHSYYQLAFSPSGAMVDMDRKKGFNTIWRSQAEAAASRAGDAWTLEIRLPAAGESQEALDPNNGIAGSMPTAENPWYINVCRQRLRADKRELSAFSPPGKASFHELMKFGKLTVK